MVESSVPSLPALMQPAGSRDPELARAITSHQQELQGLHASLLQQLAALQGSRSRGGEPAFGDDAIAAEPSLQLQDLQLANQQLQATLERYEAKRRQGMLLGRVNEEVQKRILGSEDFLQHFVPGAQCQALVMSIDIRRSTEMMLKSRSGQAFARFTSGLCQKLTDVVKTNGGVFNQFTGDGILAYFPDFLGGSESATQAVRAALQCHQVWQEHYRANRDTFRTVLLDVGLGIGLDYGTVTTVQVAELLTVTGEPVVYACRLSGAPAGQIYVNQPAYEQISAHMPEFCQLQETQLHVKHEGPTLAYAITAAAPSPAASSAAPEV